MISRREELGPSVRSALAFLEQVEGKKKPKEIVTMCDGYKPLRDANKLLKEFGLVLKWRKDRRNLGDQVYLRVEELPRRRSK